MTTQSLARNELCDNAKLTVELKVVDVSHDVWMTESLQNVCFTLKNHKCTRENELLESNSYAVVCGKAAPNLNYNFNVL